MGGGTPYSRLYGEGPPERVPFYRSQYTKVMAELGNIVAETLFPDIFFLGG